MADRRTLPFLVAVETDPLRYHGEHAVHPRPLPVAEAERLLAHVSADLVKGFPATAGRGLCLAGALYDQAQVLRPGWPLFEAMARVARRRWKHEDGETGLLSIGTADGRLPLGELQPDPTLPPGILQLLPLQLHGEPEALARLEDDMEHRFMEEGQLSALSARALEQAFGIATTHVRFLTLTDLQAMLKLQLEHFGFGALWTLVDAALAGVSGPLAVSGSGGQRFTWRDGAVHATFEPFDHWASAGGGRDVAAENLGTAYAAWTREYRQLLVTLGAHGVPVAQQLPGCDEILEGLFLEEDAGESAGRTAVITEHQGEDLGTVAVTVSADGRLRHFYPLAPEGSNALHAHIAGLGVAHQGLAYPGCICIDGDARRLVAECP